MTYDLQERVNYYNTELSKDYSNDEESLFKTLFGLFWETATPPTSKDLILMVFSSKHTSQEKTIRDYFVQLFNRLSLPHKVINTYNDKSTNTLIKSGGEIIISVLFLKFIYYFALRILELSDTSSPNLCEHLSNLADLVGLTDNERILNAAVIDIDNFLMITTESKDEIRAIIQAIHNIFSQQLKIDIPDNISIQITISVICKHKLTELKCPTVPDDTPKPEPKTDSKSWEAIMARVDARTAAGINRKIVKTELEPLLPLTGNTSNFSYAPPRQDINPRVNGINKHNKLTQQQRPALSLLKTAPAAPVVLPTRSHRVPETQSRNRGTPHSENKLKCPHGSACYRKNPEHLRKFYHTGRSPPPQKTPWKPGGGSGKSTRTRRRTVTKSTRHTRRRRRHRTRRPSSKRR